MKKFSLLPAFAFFATILFSQSYNAALGMRLGTDWGITYQHRIAKRLTLEGIIQSSLQREEVILSAMLERHMPLITRRLNMYMGAGLHKGWIGGNEELPAEDPFGLSFVGGIEFTLARLNLSYDFKPALNINGGERRFYSQSGISMRYVLIKNHKAKSKKKNKREKKNAEANDKKKFNWKFWQKGGD